MTDTTSTLLDIGLHFRAHADDHDADRRRWNDVELESVRQIIGEALDELVDLRAKDNNR